MWFETTTPFYTHNAERGKTLPRLGPTAPWTPAATHPVDEAGRRAGVCTSATSTTSSNWTKAEAARRASLMSSMKERAVSSPTSPASGRSWPRP
jgi:hypothetical protein